MARSACPVCGVGVKPDNLREHVTRVHPNAPVPEGPPGPARPARTAHRRLSRRREGLVYAVVAVVVLVALIVALFPWGPPGKAPAPAFSLTDTAGIPRSLQDYRGSWLLLDLMSTTCEWCQRLTQESLVPLYPAWSGRVQFLSVDINRQGDALPAGNARILAFKAQYGATWPYALDLDDLSRRAGVTGTPTTLLIDPEGYTVYRKGGYETLSDLTAQLERYVGG